MNTISNTNDSSHTMDQIENEFGGKPNKTLKENIYRYILKPLASLQLTVVLLALSVVLVFFGTLAQTKDQTFVVVETYFRSWFVWIPFDLVGEFDRTFFNLTGTEPLPGYFPFPGGWILATLMLLNVTVAHALRARLTWKRIGLWLVHSGLILLLTNEVITGVYSIEAQMVFKEGETLNYADINYIPYSRTFDLLWIAPDSDSEDAVTIIPGEKLVSGSTIDHPALPILIKVEKYFSNTNIMTDAGDKIDVDSLISKAGALVRVVPHREGAGTTESRHAMPMVEVSIQERDTLKELGRFKISMWEYFKATESSFGGLFAPGHTIDFQGKNYRVSMRNKRIDLPYSLKLNKFTHEKYMGTSSPKSFKSQLTLNDSELDDHREVSIEMNEPLRYRGLTFYQSSFFVGDRGSVLQVVKNPGWTIPYVACIVVTFGLLYHFSILLVRFLRGRVK